MTNPRPTQAAGSAQKGNGQPSSAGIPPGMHPALALITQTLFYKFSWPKLLASNVGLVIALIISLIINGILVTRKPDNHYFSTDPHGRITALVPLDVPLVSDEAVEQFTQGCVSRSFSLTFVPDQLREKLNSLHDCYSDAGFAALMKGFDGSNLIQKIRQDRMVSSVVATAAPVITAVTPEAPGGYVWTVQEPITITLQNQTSQRSYPFIVEASVQRVSNVDNPQGVSIIATRLMSGNNNSSQNQ
ncbi:DotI/IcmL family type IV secretion protein [Paraburkholderia sp. BR10872]|uniref:DotI/IcmL family type IV secretion protein n=1 Tax=Paraburkholderia sp. BR10872 TaxID=3236989 RepID=UPI0034D306A5